MPDEKRSAKAIFDQALEIASPDERNSYLNETCGDNIYLRKKVEALLEAYRQAGSFLESPPPGLEVTQTRPVAEGPGMMIGPYKLMEQIGEGGMGVVYVADQRQPVRRKVALKIIKPGMDTMEVIARFEAERQALALMDHPNIARVFDAGSTESGRPYFVMELVRGIPITEYCDQNKLPTSERLELFLTVCHAVKHAHQKGIIHRDVKPSNIMVTLHDGAPVPKIIDFGVAKAINQQLTERTIYTRYAQMIGTPLYMSPEQAELSGLDVDTRTDIYSLGVLLYELLTGTTPFEKERVRAAAYDEIRRIIREEEPPWPSTRISTAGQTATAISTHRKTDPKHLSQLIRGDLDWIVMRALEKDRTRRYETVGELAADVRRHLSHEPVVAGPPSMTYKLGKFARRNKAAIATVGLVAAALVLGVVVSTWQAVRATNAQVVAKDERDRATLAESRAIADRDRAVEAQRAARQERDRAEAARREALEAAEKEVEARRAAVAARKEADRYLHVVRMNVAVQAWEDDNVARAAELLGLCWPKPGEPDMRGFAWYHLWRLCQPDSMTLQHGGGAMEVWEVAWSPDDKLLASSGVHNAVKLWDAATGRLRATLKHDAEVAAAVAFSPDGKTLATGSAAIGESPQLKLWNLETHAPITSFPGHAGAEGTYSVAFSPDGKTLASSAGDATVRLWDAETGQSIATFQCDHPNPFAIAFSPDGTLLAVAGGDHDRIIPELKLWNTTTRQLQATLEGHEYLVCGVAFSPDGKTLASGGADQSIILWDVASGEIKATISGHKGIVRDLAFTSDGAMLASASYDRTVRLWDTATGRQLRRLAGHKNQARCVAFSSDDRWVATGGGDGAVRLWSAAVDEEKDTLKHNGFLYGIAFSPDGKRLVSGGEEDTVRLWDVETAELRATFRGPESGYELVAFSPDGKTVVATGDGGTISLLDVSMGSEPVPLQADSGCAFSCVRFAPDGATIATAGRDAERGMIILWDTATGRPRRTLRGHEDYVRSVYFSPDGQTLVSGSHDNTIKLWDLATGQLLGTLNGHTDAVFDVRFSPNGKTLASASLDKTVKLWDLVSGEVQAILLGHADKVRSVAFSPDGKTLASAGDDATVKLWQVDSGEELATLVGPQARIWQLEFAPDGRTLASASFDGTVRLWRAATEKEVLLSNRAASIATADDGQQRDIVSDLREFLAMKGGKGLRLADVSLVMSTTEALEEAGKHELAASACRALAETIAGSPDEKLSRAAENWKGLARRLALVGNQIELDGSLADGTPLDWAAYQGKVVLAAFWPNWFHPGELSALRRNYRLYSERGFDVLIFDIGSDPESLKESLEREQIDWAVVSLVKENLERQSAIYAVAQIPTAILINKQGQVVSLDARGRRLDGLIEQLLGPPFAPHGELSYIDLQPQTNWRLTEGTPDRRDNTLEELPRGEHVFGGVRFNISDAVIQLGSQNRPNLPDKIEGISANRSFNRLYVLHSTQFGGAQGINDGTVIGKFIIHYEDNSAETFPVVYGEDVRDWWNFDSSKPVTRGCVVWEGENPEVKKFDHTLRLYLSVWENPHPGKKVTRFDYTSTDETAAAPFCVAMTTEAP